MLEGNHVTKNVIFCAYVACRAKLEAAVALRTSEVAKFALKFEST